MNSQEQSLDRRKFIKQASLVTIGSAGLMSFSPTQKPIPSGINDLNIVGPKEGYAPQIGTLVSMMNWMRYVNFKTSKWYEHKGFRLFTR